MVSTADTWPTQSPVKPQVRHIVQEVDSCRNKVKAPLLYNSLTCQIGSLEKEHFILRFIVVFYVFSY